MPINELSKCKGAEGERQVQARPNRETDQQGRSGSGRGNEQVMNKFKFATRYKVES